MSNPYLFPPCIPAAAEELDWLAVRLPGEVAQEWWVQDSGLVCRFCVHCSRWRNLYAGSALQVPRKLLPSPHRHSHFNFQEALDGGELTSKTIEKNGQKFYEYTLLGSDCYLIQVTIADGRVYGLFIKANKKGFEADADTYRKMADSFETY